MKAVLALVILYVAMFFLAIQGASQNSAQAARQGGPGQAAGSIDPAKEADIRSLMELVGARDAMQDFAAHGADQLRDNLLASVPSSDRGHAYRQGRDARPAQGVSRHRCTRALRQATPRSSRPAPTASAGTTLTRSIASHTSRRSAISKGLRDCGLFPVVLFRQADRRL